MQILYWRWQVWQRVFKHNMTTALVWHLPRGLVYWCTIRAIAHATRFGGEMGKLKAVDVVRRWYKSDG